MRIAINNIPHKSKAKVLHIVLMHLLCGPPP